MVDIKHLQDFESLTNFPIISMLDRVGKFFNDDYFKIVNFYQGNTKQISKEIFSNLNSLIKQVEDCVEQFGHSKNLFDRAFYWEILDSTEDLKFRLYTVSNLSKFLRSSIVKSSNKTGFVVSVTLDNGQTIEDISDYILKDTSPDNDWVDIAVTNDLKERDWDIDGGKELLVRKRIVQSNLVTSFIDNTIGNKIYGRDFQNKIQFNAEGDDLVILNEEETLIQSVETLAKLCKGDIPEFKSIGIKANLYKGINYSQLNFPSLTKDLIRNFRTDDLFSVINVLDIKHEQGDIYIKFEVGTKIGEVMVKNTSI